MSRWSLFFSEGVIENTTKEKILDAALVSFAEMMAAGILKKEDPDMLAFIYTSPISALIHYCDREPGKETEIIRQIETYIKHFIKMYAYSNI